MDLLTTSVATGDSDGGPYTLVVLVGEADVTNSGVLALAGPRDPVAKMLRLTAADQLLPVYATVAEATAE